MGALLETQLDGSPLVERSLLNPLTKLGCAGFAAESLTEALYLASARAALEQERAATRRLLGSHHTDPFPRPHEMCGPGTLEYGSKTVYAPMYVANALVSNQEACRENLRGRIVARTYENERRIAAEAAAKAKADSAFLAKQAAFVGSHPHGTVGVHTKWTGHGAANPKLFSTEPTLRLSTPYRKLPLWQVRDDDELRFGCMRELQRNIHHRVHMLPLPSCGGSTYKCQVGAECECVLFLCVAVWMSRLGDRDRDAAEG